MPQWVVVLFWTWVVVSLVIFVIRRVRSRRAKLAGGSDVGPAPASSGGLLDKEWPAPPPPEPGDETFRLDPQAASPEPVQDSPPTGDHDEETPPSTGHVPPPADTPGIPTGAPTLPELLAGITLPHELVPLTQLDARVDVATHVIVATEKASAEVVRTGMIDELERLGYDIEHVSMMHLVASGPRGRVLIDIHPDGPGATEAGVARFPTALEGSVVVELRVG
ncbi:MAG: hypothetical protein U5K29_01475 [Acidimicrobiales bacterium]|nr:hypothetical protein [Acidimicrobiales bacterium]